MGGGEQRPKKKHENRKAEAEREQQWGGQKPIITGLLGPESSGEVAPRDDRSEKRQRVEHQKRAA